jgi:hypothetical protein
MLIGLNVQILSLFNFVCLLGSACCLLRAGFLLGLIIDPEDGGYMFLRNFG